MGKFRNFQKSNNGWFGMIFIDQENYWVEGFDYGKWRKSKKQKQKLGN